MSKELKYFIKTSVTGLDAIKRAPIVSYDTGIKCLRIGDVSKSNDYHFWGYTEVNNTDYEKFHIKKNDIFIARTGASIGCTFIAKKNYNSVFNNGLIRVRINENALPQYIYYLFKTNSFQSFITATGMSSATQPNIRISDLLKYSVNKFHTLTEQQHIVNTIGSLDNLIENYDNQISKLLNILEISLSDKSRVPFEYYKPQIVKSGIKKYNNTKNYLDTSSVEGINNILEFDSFSFEERPSRANMGPLSDSIWFAKMKGSKKVIIVTNKDDDLLNNYIFSTGYLGIKATNELPLSFLMGIISSPNFFVQRDLNSIGTTMAGVNNETFNKIMVPKLSNEEIKYFDEKFAPLVIHLASYRRKIKKLKKLKILLLNKYF